MYHFHKSSRKTTFLQTIKFLQARLVEKEDARCKENENEVKTIFVSGLKETTTKDSICLFFENKRRTGGGDLCEGKEGYKRISLTVACLTFVSSKGTFIFSQFNQSNFIFDP